MTVPYKARQLENRHDIQTRRAHTHVNTHEGDIKNEANLQGDELIAHKTRKRDRVHRTPSAGFQTLKREYEPCPTFEEGKLIKEHYGETNRTSGRHYGGHQTHKREDDDTPYVDSDNTLNRYQD